MSDEPGIWSLRRGTVEEIDSGMVVVGFFTNGEREFDTIYCFKDDKDLKPRITLSVHRMSKKPNKCLRGFLVLMRRQADWVFQTDYEPSDEDFNRGTLFTNGETE